VAGKRGRPKRFSSCPECGEPSIFVRHTARRGHCENVYCVCHACGASLRYVQAGTGGHWYRVRVAAQTAAASSEAEGAAWMPEKRSELGARASELEGDSRVYAKRISEISELLGIEHDAGSLAELSYIFHSVERLQEDLRQARKDTCEWINIARWLIRKFGRETVETEMIMMARQALGYENKWGSA